MNQSRDCSKCGRSVAAGARYCPYCGGATGTGPSDAASAEGSLPRTAPATPDAFFGGPPSEAWSTSCGAPDRRASILMFVPYLLFRPRACLRHFMMTDHQAVVGLMCWTLGAAAGIDRIQMKVLTGSSVANSLSWTMYWTLVALGGLIGGLLWALIRGWWFRKRLEWSGAMNPDRPLARRIFLFSVQIVAIPTIVMAIVEFLQHPSPVAAVHQADGWWYFLFIPLPFWSVWVSYRAATAAYVVRRAASIVWFLVVPGVFYLIGLGAGFAIGLFMPAGSADVAHPMIHDSRTMTFSYPGNWWIGDDEPDFDPNASVSVEPVQDALIQIYLYESDRSPDDELDASYLDYGGAIANLTQYDTFDTWGRHRGSGRSYRGQIDGAGYELRLFIAEAASGNYLEVHELWLGSDEAEVVPGLELIRSTFVLK